MPIQARYSCQPTTVFRQTCEGCRIRPSKGKRFRISLSGETNHKKMARWCMNGVSLGEHGASISGAANICVYPCVKDTPVKCFRHISFGLPAEYIRFIRHIEVSKSSICH